MSSSQELQPIKRASVPREVLKWLQSLDLSVPIKNLKRDFSNGTPVGEILYCYYPKYIFPPSFISGPSSITVQKNWQCVQDAFRRAKLDIPKSLITATMHCKDGAAELLVCKLYTLLTNRSLLNLEGIDLSRISFSDKYYEDQMPLFARTTASTAIRRNITEVEKQLQNKEDTIVGTEKILRDHFQRRCDDRVIDPERFDIKPSLGQKAIRRFPSGRSPSDGYGTASTANNNSKLTPSAGVAAAPSRQRFVEVQQLDKSKQMPIRCPSTIHALLAPTSTY